MTTGHHVPHAHGAALTSAEVNRPLAELDAAIELAMVSGSGWSTILDGTAASGQKVVPVTSTEGALPGMAVWIGTPGGTNEQRTIDTVAAGVSVTVTVNLTNTYSAGALISASPAEIVDARDGFSSLAANLEAKLGAVVDRGAGLLGLVDTPSKRMPVNLAAPMVGPDIVAAGGSSNVIAFQLSPRFTGSLAGIGGLDPGYVWGVDLFTTDGPAAGDGDGIVDLTGLASEIALQSSAADQGVIRALHAVTSLWGAASGGHVDQIEGLRISAPAFKDSAVPANWTIDAVYGLFVEAPGTVGTSNFAIFTDGGPSRFKGRLDVLGAFVQTVQMTLGGNTFPAAAVNDVFYRTDRGLWYYWDGTRWLTVQLFSEPIGNLDALAGTGQSKDIVPGDAAVAAGLYLVEFEYAFYVTGGTALSASHSWSIFVDSFVGNTNTARALVTVDSGASDVWRTLSVTGVNLALDGIDMYQVRAYKTGTPGTLTGAGRMVYRRIG